MSKSLFDGLEQSLDITREAPNNTEALSHSNLDPTFPPTVEQLQCEIARLTEENTQLKDAYKRLEERNGAHLGRMAERHIADILGVQPEPPGADWDVTTKHGAKLEIKYATASSRNKDSTYKWRWTHILGEQRTKMFDMIILIGSIESCTFRYYEKLSNIDGDFVYFVIPFEKIQTVMYNVHANAIDVNVRPPIGKKPPTSRANKLLFRDYRVSRAEIVEKFV